MRTLLVVIAMLGSAAPTVADRQTDLAKARGELVAAIAKRDVKGVASRVKLPLRLRSLRFAAEACKKFTGSEIDVPESELATFVGCLADLGIKELNGPHDVWVTAVYGPGLPLVLSPDVALPTAIHTIYSYSKPGSDLFVIEPVTFSSHITKFTREIAPAQAMKKAIDASTTDHVVAIVNVCVDPHGKVEASASVHDDAFKAYEQVVTKAASAWSIKPFTFAGAAVHSCSTLSVGYPAARIDVPLEMRPPSPQVPLEHTW